MNTKHGSHLVGIDYLRAVAVLAVIAFHLNPALLPGGFVGVDIFFVISGFVIARSLAKKVGSPIKEFMFGFYRRRMIRIAPALIVFVVILSIIDAMFIPSSWLSSNNSKTALAGIVGLSNVFLSRLTDGYFFARSPYNPFLHTWSLGVEEQFYLFWPLVVWLMPRKWLPWLCIFLLAIGTNVREWTDVVFGHKWSEASYVLPYCRMDGLAAGSLMAVLVHNGKIKFKGLEQVIVRDLTFICFLGLLYYMVAGDSQVRGTYAALTFAGFVYLALCEQSMVRNLCETRFLRHIGMYSYGLYVFHQLLRMPFTWYIQEPLLSTGLPLYAVQILYMLLAFAATYVCARISWVLIEKPFLDLKTKKTV
jgi:peptidoglycan/LPS O-acetylase OafA/YrhL